MSGPLLIRYRGDSRGLADPFSGEVWLTGRWSGIAGVFSLMARSHTHGFASHSLRVFNGAVTFFFFFFFFLQNIVSPPRQQQELSPSELIKINVCACAVRSTKEKWLKGAHHWRGWVKSPNEWEASLLRSDRNINRNNEVTVGLGLFAWARTRLGPLDPWKVFSTLRPLFRDFTSSPSWNTQDVLLQVFSKVEKKTSVIAEGSLGGALVVVSLLNANDSCWRVWVFRLMDSENDCTAASARVDWVH